MFTIVVADVNFSTTFVKNSFRKKFSLKNHTHLFALNLLNSNAFPKFGAELTHEHFAEAEIYSFVADYPYSTFLPIPQ
jgi:hypothetical protein